jgi:hypothetical protein
MPEVIGIDHIYIAVSDLGPFIPITHPTTGRRSSPTRMAFGWKSRTIDRNAGSVMTGGTRSRKALTKACSIPEIRKQCALAG